MNDERGDDVQIRVASEWVGLSLRRVLGFGRRVGGGKPSTNENHEPSANGRCANESRFGLGGIVCFDRLSTTPGRVLGFGGRVRGLCEEGASHLTDRRIFVSGRILAIGLTLLSQVRRTRAIASGWVGLSLWRILGSGGVSVGESRPLSRVSEMAKYWLTLISPCPGVQENLACVAE